MSAVGFFGVAARQPDRVGLVAPDGRELTYGELGSAAASLATGFAGLGLGAGDVVAVAMPNGTELTSVFAAAMAAGLCYVPLNWHLTAAELRYILTDSGARVVVGHERYGSALAGAAETVQPSHRFAVGAVPGFRPLGDLSASHPVGGMAPGEPGHVLFYTSGTTGYPKGVRKRFSRVAPERSGVSTGIGLPVPPLEEALGSDTVTLVGGPLYHAAPLAHLARGLDGGAKVVLMDRWTPTGFLDLVERHRVTEASMVPTMFHRLLALPDDARSAADLSSLRSVTHAGAPCPPEVKRRIIDWFGPIVTESYSSTEGAGTTVTSQEWLARPGTVGRPSPGVVLKVLDDEGNECPPGTEGRVFLSQALWTFEYHGDPAKTREGRVGELFTVGDIGYVDDDGYLFLCDRVADVIVSGGVNIYPAEVEAVLLEHPAVADAAVVGAPNDEWGEEVRAVVELRPDHLLPADVERELLAHCRDRVAHFKCPVAVDVVDSLGRDPNGKLRKGPIRARYWEGRTRRI